MKTGKTIKAEGGYHKNVKHGWVKTDGASLFFKNPHWTPEDINEVKRLNKRLLSDLRNAAPVITPPVRRKVTEGHLLVIDPADVHIGKLATSLETGKRYDQQIAIKRVRKGVKSIISKVSVPIDKVLLVIGNDILHTDTPKRLTTSGTPQDTDGMWYENFLNAKRLYVDLIMGLMQIANVHVVYNPSNHDYTTGFYLAQVVEAHFWKCKGVSFDITPAHRKAFRYYNNLIGTTHGDGAKQNDLPLLLAQEFKKDWGKTDHRYIYSHHLHHKITKDYAGVTFETMRSPSEADSWHHRNGYQHCPKAIEGFIHHKQHGQIMRITHLF